jgi:LPXTG-motif cell wall-anchored protein
VVRYSNNGSLDSTFDTDGKTATDIGTNSNDQAQSIVVQTDGRIVVAGYSNALGSYDFTLVRYNATPLSATLASASTTSSSASIAYTVTGTEAIDCTTLSTTSGVDFNFTGITEITSITQTSPTLCTIGATSQANAGGVAVTSTLTVASSFSIGFANGNTRTTLSGTSLSIVVTIPAVVTSVSPTTTIAASTTTTIAAVVTSSTKKVTATKNELPKTGSDSFPLVALALGLLSAGLVVTTRKRFTRR